MNDCEYIKVIEYLNREYIEMLDAYRTSPEYQMGKALKRMIDILKGGFFKPLWEQLRGMQVQRKVVQLGKPNQEDLYINLGAEMDTVDKKVTVYTCITGGYDQIEKCEFKKDNLEYVLITDDVSQNEYSNWKKVSVDSVVSDSLMGNFKNRYCKMHPFELFPDSDYSVYVDGNVRVISDITPLLSIARDSKIGIAMHRHPLRNCAYFEAQACILYRRGSKDKLLEQVDLYKKEGFPYSFGLLEATIIIIDLKNEIAHRIMDAWWEEYCRSGSNRDQIALPYILWKMGYSMEDVGNLGNNLRYNPKLRYVGIGHPSENNSKKAK